MNAIYEQSPAEKAADVLERAYQQLANATLAWHQAKGTADEAAAYWRVQLADAAITKLHAEGGR